MPLNYVDFEIEVSPDGRIEARSAEAGEAQGVFTLDQNQIGLALRLLEMEPDGNTNAALLKGLGSQLYAALLPPTIHTHFQATLAAARAGGLGVRLRLNVDASAWAALPWELLFLPDAAGDSGVFLAQSAETALSRYIDVPLPRRDVRPLSPPLRILFVVAQPTGTDAFDPAQEQTMMREALAAQIAAGQVAIDVLDQATPQKVRRQLRANDYTVFHFVGHGAFRDDTGAIALEANDGTRAPQLLDEEEFSAFFLGERKVSLVVLHACQGAKLSSVRPFAGVAPRLVARGLPAVIAMAYPVRYTTAQLFSAEFYDALAQGWPIDAAMQAARAAIAQDVGFDLRDFATPRLFMRARDGVIVAKQG